jgi:hypothetical protein
MGSVIRKGALALAFAAALAGDGRRPIPWERNRLRIGQALYRENCAVCHDIDRPQSKKFGPSFYQLFRRTQMPIAQVKPNREYIKLRITSPPSESWIGAGPVNGTLCLSPRLCRQSGASVPGSFDRNGPPSGRFIVKAVVASV